jgi:hypothetical protein
MHYRNQGVKLYFLSFIMSYVAKLLSTLMQILGSLPSFGAISVIGLRLGTKFGPDIILLYVMDRIVKSAASRLKMLFRHRSGRSNEGGNVLSVDHESQ